MKQFKVSLLTSLLLSISLVVMLAAGSLAPVGAEDAPINVDASEDAAALGGVAAAFTPPPQPGAILLLDDGGSPGQEGKQALDVFVYTYTHATPAAFATVNLDDYDIIYVAWLPTQAEIDALNARKTDLAAWISGGGGIVVNAEWKGTQGVTNPYSFLPVAFDTGTGQHTDGVHIVSPTHPLAAGLTDAMLDGWGNSVHGPITAIPPEATIVSVATALGDSPHIVGTCYGGGKIVVVASDPEYHVAYNVPTTDGPEVLLSNELSWAAVPCVIEVDIDIKPMSDPNSINPKSNGLVPVAILGSDTFDVTDVDVTTLMFGVCGAETAEPAHDLTDPLVYTDHLQDVNLDGFVDLVSHYHQKDTGLTSIDTEACLVGATTGGTPITGSDSVRVLGE